MKKFLRVLTLCLVLVLAFSLMLPAAYAGNAGDPEASPEASPETSPEASPEASPETSPEPEHQHTEETIPAVLATCTTKGLTEGKKCSVCGDILVAQKEIPALGHDYSKMEVVKEPTCTVEGVEEGVCSRCGETVQRVIPAGHDWSQWQDSGDGWHHVRYCNTDRSHKEIAAHQMGNWVKQDKAGANGETYWQRWCQADGCTYHESYTKTGNPPTGDTSHVLLFGTLALISAAGLAGVLIYTKKRKQQ